MIKTMRGMSNPKIYVSIDTIGKQSEWIRHGLNFDTFELNLFQILGQDIPVGLMVTFNFLSIPKFKEFLEYVLQLKVLGDIKLDTPYMTDPKHLSALITDDDQFTSLLNTLKFMESHTDDNDPKKFNSGEYEKFKTVVRWIEENRFTGDDLNNHRKDFKLFVDEHDRRRGSEWHVRSQNWNTFIMAYDNEHWIEVLKEKRVKINEISPSFCSTNGCRLH